MAVSVPVASELNRWYFKKEDIKNAPSVSDGLHPDEENAYRIQGVQFIKNLGSALGMHYMTIATGIIFFHRFYMFRSFKTFPRYVTAFSCFFLSGKVEETPKKCQDMLVTARKLLTPEQFVEFGENPRKNVMIFERIVLQTIHFDFIVDVPYSYLADYIRGLQLDDTITLEKLAQTAWTLINDSFCTTVCLQWEPEVITVALIYLATKMKKCKILSWANRMAHQKYWWEVHMQGLTTDILEDICHQVLDYYSTPLP